MKGILKGLRYITQIFVEEEEENTEIEIGLPTDVKHVAHIGWDGPSVNSPSWMNDFKSSAPGNSSSPLPANGDVNGNIEESQDSSVKERSVKESQGRDLPELPKPSESHNQKSKSTRRHHKHKEGSNSPKAESSGSGSQTLPKKSRRKKSRDSDGSTKSSHRSKDKGSRHGSRHESEDGSSKQYNEASASFSLASLKEEEDKPW